ncbi:bifunctional sugar phosphate isomerase/epimerase/4-hydroxyphenylpyruvate dioxygenase family protein [Mycobacterium sp. URHB0021]
MSTPLGHDDDRGIRRAIATVCLSGMLEAKLDAVAGAGFDGVEIFENDLIASLSTPAEVRKRCADLGLSIDLYQPFRDFDTVLPDRLTANLRRADHKFAVMEELGTDMMLVCSSVSGDAVDDPARISDQLHELAERASRRGMKIAYEALAWGRHVNRWNQSWNIVRRGDHPALGLCLDSFHVLSRTPEPEAISAISEIPGDRIFFLQLADAPLMSMDVLQWSRHHRLFPGQGEFDLPRFVDHILTAGYAGPLSLEVFNDVFRQSAPVHTAVDALRSLLVLEEAVARRSPPKAVAFGLTCPPPVPKLSGHAFVGLSADAGSVTGLAGALTSFGFTKTGADRSSNTQLWQQGDARILLNQSTDIATDVAEIASLGFDSDSKDQLAARATAFFAPASPLDDSGMAVTAPDGTTLWFCDPGGQQTWTSEYAPTGEGIDAGTGMTRIDHVALTQPFDYFDEAALFYRAVLGLAPGSDTEFAAPFGLVRGRAVSDPSGRVRIALQRTLLRRGEWAPAVREPQHVAFATTDLFATARALRERGARLLTVSNNYYEDLDARFALDPALIEAMREYGILYDREHGGEFYHLYTPVYGSRVFFEVVQRVGSYASYGAANSAVRMAAQRRERENRLTSPMPDI